MRFAKGHGTGNDFVILPDPDGVLPLTPTFVAALCDRRRGIGADGVLRVVRSAAHPDAEASAETAEWFMDYWNADGSQSEMCGNGVRVYARYLAEAGLVAPEGSFNLVTRAGVVPVTIGEEIAAGMPMPRVYVQSEATSDGRVFGGTAVDVGNPHLVCPVDEPTLERLDLTRAPGIDPLIFPAGVNVEFAAAGARRSAPTCTGGCASTNAAPARPSPADPARARWRRWRSTTPGWKPAWSSWTSRAAG
ncbi:hypothetical protein GCM10027610_138290 [Dactylosporangium cerinum]